MGTVSDVNVQESRAKCPLIRISFVLLVTAGNLASKFVASKLYNVLMYHLPTLPYYDESISTSLRSWRHEIQTNVTVAFEEVHTQFLETAEFVTSPIIEAGSAPSMDQSGTTATALLVTDKILLVTSLGDSRAVLSSRSVSNGDQRKMDFPSMSAIQLSIDHVASDPAERTLVEERGGSVITDGNGGISRVEGKLAITRSIGDANLSSVLSREPNVMILNRSEIHELCDSGGSSGGAVENKAAPTTIPCFVILASDGLWDVMSNEEAVDMVVDVILHDDDSNTMHDEHDFRNDSSQNMLSDSISSSSSGSSSAFQKAAERLAVEAYVRGSTDNIGVCIVAVDID
jgi:protein phosphatase 1L